MADCDIAHLVYIDPPDLVGLDLSFVDRTDRPGPKEFLGTRQACRNPAMGVWMGTVLHPGPIHEFNRSVGELADEKTTGGRTSLQESLTVLCFKLPRRALVSWCGGQACCSGVTSAVEFEPVMPLPAACP